jgi:hypothetical protein
MEHLFIWGICRNAEARAEGVVDMFLWGFQGEKRVLCMESPGVRVEDIPTAIVTLVQRAVPAGDTVRLITVDQSIMSVVTEHGESRTMTLRSLDGNVFQVRLPCAMKEAEILSSTYQATVGLHVDGSVNDTRGPVPLVDLVLYVDPGEPPRVRLVGFGAGIMYASDEYRLKGGVIT